MPTPITKDIWQLQEIKHEVPLDCFQVYHGYKDRDEIKIRLEADGTVRLFDCRESRMNGEDKIVAIRVPFGLFAAEWRRFVAELKGKAEKET